MMEVPDTHVHKLRHINNHRNGISPSLHHSWMLYVARPATRHRAWMLSLGLLLQLHQPPRAMAVARMVQLRQPTTMTWTLVFVSVRSRSTWVSVPSSIKIISGWYRAEHARDNIHVHRISINNAPSVPWMDWSDSGGERCMNMIQKSSMPTLMVQRRQQQQQHHLLHRPHQESYRWTPHPIQVVVRVMIRMPQTWLKWRDVNKVVKIAMSWCSE